MLDPGEVCAGEKITFARDFLSGISNPKNLIFYLSLFSLIFTDSIGLWIRIAFGLWMASLVFFWDACIVFLLSRGVVRRFFSRLVFYIDKAAGSVPCALGITLVGSAVLDESL